MKHHRLGSLDHRCFLSTVLEAGIPTSRLSAGEGFHGLSLWLADGLFSVSSQICVLIYYSYKAIHVESGNHMSLFYFNCPFQGSISKYCHIVRYLKLELQHVDLG